MRKHSNAQYLKILVIDNDIEKAITIWKKKMQMDGLFKKLKEKRAFEKPSAKKKRKKRDMIKRVRLAEMRRDRYKRRY